MSGVGSRGSYQIKEGGIYTKGPATLHYRIVLEDVNSPSKKLPAYYDQPVRVWLHPVNAKYILDMQGSHIGDVELEVKENFWPEQMR